MVRHGGRDEWPLMMPSFMVRSCKSDAMEV